MKISHFHHIGKRTTQEDDLYVDPNGKLFIVCDGVGGRDYGEKASALVIESIVNKFATNENITSAKEIDELIASLNLELTLYLKGNAQQSGMASTLVLLYINDHGKAIVSHIGDSRLYHIKSREDWWMTTDHSMVMELRAAGILSSDKEMHDHPLRNRITNAVKITEDMSPLKPETTELDDLQPGQLIVLCSDGVMELFSGQELVDLLCQGPIDEAWKTIEDQCLESANDNFTAILIEL